MTRDEAIRILKYNSNVIHKTINGETDPNEIEALDMAIKALQLQQDCKDYVSRQAAIDALMEFDKKLRKINWYQYPYTEHECRGVDEAIVKIANLPPAQLESHWISVEERLPKQDEMVLITIIRKDERYNKIPFISIGYISWNNTVWWCAHDGDCKSANVEVLAWMPLPEPYRAERRTDDNT